MLFNCFMFEVMYSRRSCYNEFVSEGKIIFDICLKTLKQKSCYNIVCHAMASLLYFDSGKVFLNCILKIK